MGHLQRLSGFRAMSASHLIASEWRLFGYFAFVPIATQLRRSKGRAFTHHADVAVEEVELPTLVHLCYRRRRPRAVDYRRLRPIGAHKERKVSAFRRRQPVRLLRYRRCFALNIDCERAVRVSFQGLVLGAERIAIFEIRQPYLRRGAADPIDV
jgi:hypothetical protein